MNNNLDDNKDYNQNNNQNFYQNNNTNYYQNNNTNYNPNGNQYYNQNNNQNYYQNNNMNYNPNNNQNYNQNYYQNNNMNYNSNNNSNYGQNYNNQNYNQYNQGYGQMDSFGRSIDRETMASKVIGRSFIVMFVALLITAVTASMTALSESTVRELFDTNLFYVIAGVEFVIVMGASAANHKKMTGLAAFLFIVYSIMNGLTFSILFYIFDIRSIQNVFLLSALVFGIMAIVGATTKINLSKLGSICFMALIAMILVTFANILFLHNSGLNLILDYVGVLVFIGLTAYDTQKMKAMASSASVDNMNNIALYCGIELYLDFINLFIRLLSIFGKGRD